MLTICLSKNIEKTKFHDLTMPGGNELEEGINENEENFEICTFYNANITNLGQSLGQSINFHSKYTKMRLRNLLKICLAFCKTEPQYAYKCYAYKKTCIVLVA